MYQGTRQYKSCTVTINSCMRQCPASPTLQNCRNLAKRDTSNPTTLHQKLQTDSFSCNSFITKPDQASKTSWQVVFGCHHATIRRIEKTEKTDSQFLCTGCSDLKWHWSEVRWSFEATNAAEYAANPLLAARSREARAISSFWFLIDSSRKVVLCTGHCAKPTIQLRCAG